MTHNGKTRFLWFFYIYCPLRRSNANCRSSGLSRSIRNLTNLLPVSPLGLRVCENEVLKTKVWPHSTSVQAQYKSASFLSFQSDFRMVAGWPHSGHLILKTRMFTIPHAIDNNADDFTLTTLIFRPYRY